MPSLNIDSFVHDMKKSELGAGNTACIYQYHTTSWLDQLRFRALVGAAVTHNNTQPIYTRLRRLQPYHLWYDKKLGMPYKFKNTNESTEGKAFRSEKWGDPLFKVQEHPLTSGVYDPQHA